MFSSRLKKNNLRLAGPTAPPFAVGLSSTLLEPVRVSENITAASVPVQSETLEPAVKKEMTNGNVDYCTIF